ncbi:hypothetical protein V7S43_013415 [Phytophthora oleae]|uniref:Uncharacterized protein n=1 Tax=Phytophthora oleae TaxID=2107226 RepID=A0ABD3F567_9STRA
MSDAFFAPTVIFLCLLHYFRLELAASGWLKGVDGRIATVVFSDEAEKLQLADFFTTDIAWRMNGREIALVNSYELIQRGYLVFGDKYLISFDEWEVLSSMAPFRDIFHLWNHRVLVWTLLPEAVDGAGGRALESVQPQMWRLDDHRLQKVRWWQVSACGIQC